MTVKELKQKLIGIDENPEDDETAELACRDDVFVITDEI